MKKYFFQNPNCNLSKAVHVPLKHDGRKSKEGFLMEGSKAPKESVFSNGLHGKLPKLFLMEGFFWELELMKSDECCSHIDF